MFSFSYSATTLTFTVDPLPPDVAMEIDLMNPVIRSAGNVPFVHDSTLKKMFATLAFRNMRASEFTSLLEFLDEVDGISNDFICTTPASIHYKARIWNADAIRSKLVAYGAVDVTVELLLECELRYITDESGNYITDESGNRLMASI
jgi:hypothetical protein